MYNLKALVVLSITKNPNLEPLASWVPTAENLRMRSLEENKIIGRLKKR